MNELFRRFAAHPIISVELLLASLFANTLALASSIFVIQVLNRYVSYGVDATLATLTIGVVAAIFLEVCFRQCRLILAGTIVGETHENRAIGTFGILMTAKRGILDQFPAGARREAMRGLDTVESTYSAPNIAAILDVPFALLFIAALMVLSIPLGVIAFAFISAVFITSVVSQRLLREPMKKLSETAAVGNALITSSDQAADTVRAFNATELMMAAWRSYVVTIQSLRRRIGTHQGLSQTISQSAQALMGVAIIATGAVLVVAGELNIGLMIGANIIASRALGPIVRFAQLNDSIAKAVQALDGINKMASLPVERDGGSALSEYAGGLELRDVSFIHPGASQPLFESLSLTLQPGAVLVTTGKNGAGKTTLARLLINLIEPTRGQILADGVDLQQLAPTWWRRQVMYMPQEPMFINGTIRENLLIANPELTEESMNKVLRDADLGQFIDESPNGLDSAITNNGHDLALGIRRRLALARALATGGRLAIFDEPTVGLDDEGCAAVYSVMKDLASKRCTIIVISHNKTILRGARIILDLNSKPVPALVNVPIADVVGGKTGTK